MEKKIIKQREKIYKLMQKKTDLDSKVKSLEDEISEERKALQSLEKDCVAAYMMEHTLTAEEVISILSEQQEKEDAEETDSLDFDSDDVTESLDDDSGTLTEIIAGDFFICSAPEDSDDFESLSENMIQKYKEQFRYPEKFTLTPTGIVVTREKRFKSKGRER